MSDTERQDEPMLGDWLCDQCGFVLSTRTLHASTGNVSVRAVIETEYCPNDGTPLRTRTWREFAKELMAMIGGRDAEIAELRKDSARLDAICQPGASTRVAMRALRNQANPPMRRFALASIPNGTHSSLVSDRPTLREAIDAAMGKPPLAISQSAPPTPEHP